MVSNKIKEIKTLIVRLAVVGGIVVLGVLIWRWWSSGSEKNGFEIEDTPLHVEEIRRIIQLNTMRFRDEVVVDSLEHYASPAEQFAGNLEKLIDPDQIKHGIASSNVRRRLTMIVKGELLYGADLKRKDFSVTPENGKLIVRIPQPELLAVNLTPENTEIFVENGEWRDFERQALLRKAREKMIASGERLQLREKSKEPLERLLRQLIRTNLPLEIRYE